MTVISHAGVYSGMIALDNQACQQVNHFFLQCNLLLITGNTEKESWHYVLC